MGNNFTGPDEWCQLFGPGIIANQRIPILPRNSLEILTQPCPFDPKGNQSIKDTHILFLMPKCLGDQPTTLLNWNQVMAEQSPVKRACIWGDWWHSETFARQGISNSKWILMPKVFLPELGNNAYPDQLAELKQYQDRHPSATAYQPITSLELSMGTALYGLRATERLFEKIYQHDEETFYTPFARTKDITDKQEQICLNGFSLRELTIRAEEENRFNVILFLSRTL